MLALQDNKTSHANMHNIVIEKEKLLNILRDNRCKHDALYNIACSGYWEQSKTELENKRAEIQKAIEEFKVDSAHEADKYLGKIEGKERFGDAIYLSSQIKIQSSIALPYPENRTKDYARAISMIELSVYNTVELSEQEFDAYVLNNWEWKKKFVDTNDRYVKALSNKYGRDTVYSLVTGSYGAQGTAGANGPVGCEGMLAMCSGFADSIMVNGASS